MGKSFIKFIESIFNAYEAPSFQKEIKSSMISIINDFRSNWDNIIKFNNLVYENNLPKIVLCGINPGRLGAGKTGIPLIDFNSLSMMLPEIQKADTERSAQFFYSIVDHFGLKKFYQHFYVTNISPVGFVKNGKNLNYNDLPPKAQEHIFKSFKKEMDFIKPVKIISLGQTVNEDLKRIYSSDESIDLSTVLPHPNYSAFPKNQSKCRDLYISTLEELIK